MDPASHGETIKNEIIGSGDASIPFDTFKVKQSPVTFIHSPQSETGSISSLNIIIDGVEWREVRDLVESKPTDRHYITSIDQKDVMSVTFGDGKNGATPPSGQDNILASYRKGIGLSGNVGAQVISSALSSSPVIKSVANPLPAFGGKDRESIH